MNCIECKKPLKRYAAELTTPSGEVIGWGPKCARKALKAARRRASARPRGTTTTTDPRQMVLCLEAA